MKKHLFALVLIAILPIFAKAQSIPANIPSNGLIGWWPFNGNANDESGNGNDGTVNGASLTSNRFNEPNGAYEFDGNNDFISIPHSESLNNSSEITVNCWILLEDSDSLRLNNIIGKDNDTFGNRSWFFGVTKNIIVTATFNPNQNDFQLTSNEFNFLQNWKMVTFTIGNDSIKIYVDGIMVLGNFYDSPLSQITEPIKIGVMDETNGANWFFDGKIDDIGIWNRALTANEIQSLIENTNCSNLIQHNDTLICSNSSLTLNSSSIITNSVETINNFIFSAKNNANNKFTIWKKSELSNQYQPLFNDAYHRIHVCPSEDQQEMIYVKYRRNTPDNVFPMSTQSLDSAWVCRSNIDGSNEQTIFLVPQFNRDAIYSLDWSPDKSKILYVKGNDANQPVTRDGDVYEYSILSNTHQNLTNDFDNYEAHAKYFNNGTGIIYSRNLGPDVAWNVWIYSQNPIGSEPELIVNNIPYGAGGAMSHLTLTMVEPNEIYFRRGTPGLGGTNYLYKYNTISSEENVVISRSGLSGFPIGNFDIDLSYNNMIYIYQNLTRIDSFQITDISNFILDNNYCSWLGTQNYSDIKWLGAPTSYLWSTGETTPSITVSPSETTTYTLTVTQGSQTCTDQVTVTVIPSPTVELTTNSPVIAGANLQLNASSTPGTTFQWTGPNNFTSTEQNPVVTNSNAFNAGTYSVTPTLNGCQGVTVSTNVQIIPSDNVLTLYMDTVPGINGQETLVNMRVRNFTNMLSAQFTLQFDPSVVSYLGFTNPAVSSITGNSFGQIQIANGILTFAWSQPNVIPVSLSDGTVLFSLRFQAVGIGGTSTPVQFVNTPTPLEFVDQSFIPLNSWIVNPGRIEILNLTTISGSLTLPNGVGIRSATISASGFSNQSTQSALDGSYSINLAEGQSYSITPSKGNDTLVANGITTLDAILIQRHILGTLLLNSPYKIIAADVNLSGTITSADINLINALILANINQYPSGLFWSFVPDDYSFPNPVNPFPFPSSRNYPSLSGTVNENYIGVKLGDVNYTYNNALARLSAVTDSVSLYIEDQVVQEGSTINVPVKVKNFNNMAGFQLALEWDPQVISFNGVNSNNGGLAVNIGATQANSGLLNINWIEPNSSVATIQDDSALFVITFEVIGEVGTNSAINIVSSPTAPIELINEILEVADYGIENGNILVNIPSGITNYFENTITVFPNPASNFIQINCESCIQENKYTVHLYNSIGQLAHKQEIVSFPASISIENSMSTGLYFLMIEERESGSRFVKKVQIKNH